MYKCYMLKMKYQFGLLLICLALCQGFLIPKPYGVNEAIEAEVSSSNFHEAKPAFIPAHFGHFFKWKTAFNKVYDTVVSLFSVFLKN